MTICTAQNNLDEPINFIPVKLLLYKNGHVFEERIAENDDDLQCFIEMDTGTGSLDAAGLYQILLDKGWDSAIKTYSVCHSYEKWGELQQEEIEITVKLFRMDTSGKNKVSAINLALGIIGGVGCGTAASVMTLFVGMGLIWLLMFFMAFLATLPVLFYILFILAGLAALVLVVITYVSMYAATGISSRSVYFSVARIDRQEAVPSSLRAVGAIVAALSIPPFFLVVQTILSHWRIGDFNEQLIKIFGNGFSAVEISSWGWMVWLNLLVGVGIAAGSAWNKPGVEDKDTINVE
jgi:hypothetical protein